MPIKKYQQAIPRFRVSSHRPGIELGRHQKPYLPVEKRLCHFAALEKSTTSTISLYIVDFM